MKEVKSGISVYSNYKRRFYSNLMNIIKIWQGAIGYFYVSDLVFKVTATFPTVLKQLKSSLANLFIWHAN